MKFIAVTLALFFSLSCFAQELKTKKILTTHFKEILTLDKKSKLKNGQYFKISLDTKDTLVSGVFRDDVKTGIWHYRGKGNTPWISYDYDKNSFTQLPEQISRIDSFLIRNDDSFVFKKVDLPAVYHGYENEIQSILTMNFRIPVDLMKIGFSGTSVASFIVDKNGEMTDFEIEKMIRLDVNTSILNAVKMIDREWSPAILNGQPVDSKFFLFLDIKPQGESCQIKENPNVIVIQLQYFGITRTVKLGQVIVSEPGMSGRNYNGSPNSTKIIRRY